MSDISDINARLRQILKMIATIGFLVASECTKFVSARNPLGGSLQRSSDPLPCLRGTLLLRGRGGEGRSRSANSWIRPWCLSAYRYIAVCFFVATDKCMMNNSDEQWDSIFLIGVRMTWCTQSTKTAKIFWVTLDGAMQGGVLTS